MTPVERARAMQQLEPQQFRPPQDDRSARADLADRADDLPIPAQTRGPAPTGVVPRPFAHGSVEVVLPAPREGSSRTPTTERRPTRPPEPKRREDSVLVLVAVLVAVLLLLCGLYTVSTVRGRSATASSPVPVPGLHDVTYTVTTAHGSALAISYSQSTRGGEYAAGSATNVPSPWQLDARVNDDYGPSLAASVVPSGDVGEVDDTITCTIVDRGRTIASMTRSGFGASVSCLP